MIKPMLCQEAAEPFNNPGYLWETKYDGVRALVSVDAAGHKIQARSGTDKTRLFPELVIKTRFPAILDGEIVSADGKFNAIQHRANRQNGILSSADRYPAIYEVFDILEVDGPQGHLNLRFQPLWKRKDILEQILLPNETTKLSTYTYDGIALFKAAESAGDEGVVGKDIKQAYLENKRAWLKVKTWQMETFLAVGYTKGTGWREKSFGALVLSDAHGVYVGEVGTGFNDEDIARICGRFIPGACPFSKEPEPATWIKPFGVKIRYLEKSNDGILRFPSYKGDA